MGDIPMGIRMYRFRQLVPDRPGIATHGTMVCGDRETPGIS
jgi:hypothetical protein